MKKVIMTTTLLLSVSSFAAKDRVFYSKLNAYECKYTNHAVDLSNPANSKKFEIQIPLPSKSQSSTSISELELPNNTRPVSIDTSIETDESSNQFLKIKVDRYAQGASYINWTGLHTVFEPSIYIKMSERIDSGFENQGGKIICDLKATERARAQK